LNTNPRGISPDRGFHTNDATPAGPLGTSHKVYKTPWQGDPRVNIQRGKDGNAKAYQVRQVLDAIARLEAGKNEEGDDDA
jgi:hypothetical protein